jgi:hypothetical protein
LPRGATSNTHRHAVHPEQKGQFKTKFKAREYVLLRLHQRETDEAMRGRSALTAANLLLRG